MHSWGIQCMCVPMFVWNCVPHINTCMTSFQCLLRTGFSFPAWLNRHNVAVRVTRDNQNTPVRDPHVCYWCLSPNGLNTHTHTRIHACALKTEMSVMGTSNMWEPREKVLHFFNQHQKFIHLWVKYIIFKKWNDHETVCSGVKWLKLQTKNLFTHIFIACHTL